MLDHYISSYYVEKSGVIAISGFIQRESSDARVSLNTTGFHIEGKEGRWLAFDSIIVDGRQFFLMEHETYRKDGAWTVVDEEGKLIVDHVCHGFDKPVQRQIKEYLDSPQLAEESAQQKIQKSRKSVLKKLRQKQAEIAKRNRKPEQKMAIAEDREYRRK